MMKRIILLLIVGSSCLYASEIKHEVGVCSKHKVEPYLYINMGPLFESAVVNNNDHSARSRASLHTNASVHVAHRSAYIDSVSLSGVKKCLRPVIYVYSDKLEEVIAEFNLEALKAQRQFLMDQLSKHSLSIDERVIYSKQIELLIHHYNSRDMQSFITIAETDSHESAESAVSYLRSRHQMGAFNQEAMRIVDQVYYNRSEMVVNRRNELAKAESAVREFFCTNNSLTDVRYQIENRQRILSSGKHTTGKSLTEIEKLIMQKEIDLMRESLREPGMKAVEVMQQKTTTFQQALWEYSRLGDCSDIVKNAARATLESYPEYAAYRQEKLLEKQQALSQHTDLVQTTPTKVINISSDVDARIEQELRDKVFVDPVTDFDAYIKQMKDVLDDMQQRGDLTPVPNRNQQILGIFAKSFIDRLHPVTQFQDCVSAIGKLAWWSLTQGGQYHHITADQIEHAEQTIQELFHTIASIDPRKLTEEQRAHLLGALAGDVVFFKGFGASFSYLQEIGALSKAEQKLATLVEAVDKIVETAPSEVVRVATIDGEVVEVRHKVSLFQKMGKEVVKDVGSQAVKETSVLKSTAEKIIDGGKTVAKPLDYAHSAIQYQELKGALRTREIAQKMSTVFEELCVEQVLLDVPTKELALQNLKHMEALPFKISETIKDATQKFQDFCVFIGEDKNYIVSMIKPGNVPGSKAIYYKRITPQGETLEVFKDTFDNCGKFVHRKFK